MHAIVTTVTHHCNQTEPTPHKGQLLRQVKAYAIRLTTEQFTMILPQWIAVCISLQVAMAFNLLIPPEIPKFDMSPRLNAVTAALARNPSKGQWRDYLLNVKQMIEFAKCREQDRFYAELLRKPRCDHLVTNDLKKLWAKSIRRSLELKSLFSFSTG